MTFMTKYLPINLRRGDGELYSPSVFMAKAVNALI